MVYFLAFVLGAVLGSFYGVLIQRIPAGMDFVKSRSRCFQCGAVLTFWDLIPLVSYLLWRGRCRHCHQAYSVFYPLLELVTGALLVLALALWGISLEAVYYFVIWSLMMMLALIDYREGFIYDLFWMIMMAANLIFTLMLPDKAILDLIWGGLAGFIFYGLIYLLGRLILRKEALGQGDIFFLTAVGGFVGWQLTVFIGFLAFFVAAFWLLGRYILTRLRRLEFNPVLYFAPCIAIATFLTNLLWQPVYGYLLDFLLGRL